eukprot:1155780-Pelagomonas_calceolata.AAC.3
MKSTHARHRTLGQALKDWATPEVQGPECVSACGGSVQCRKPRGRQQQKCQVGARQACTWTRAHKVSLLASQSRAWRPATQYPKHRGVTTSLASNVPTAASHEDISTLSLDNQPSACRLGHRQARLHLERPRTSPSSALHTYSATLALDNQTSACRLGHGQARLHLEQPRTSPSSALHTYSATLAR